MPLLGQCGPTFARKTNQGGWTTCQGLVSSVNMTYKHAHMATLMFFPGIVHFPLFLLYRTGMMSTLLDSGNQTRSIWLGLKGDFFSSGTRVFCKSPKTGSTT